MSDNVMITLNDYTRSYETVGIEVGAVYIPNAPESQIPYKFNGAYFGKCEYCGSRGQHDIRGNCGACGAPV